MEDGSKRPQSAWKRYQERPATDDEIDAWYGDRTGVGIVTGRISGNLVCLDGDDPDTLEGFIELARQMGHGELVDRLLNGWSEASPMAVGRKHIYFRVAGDMRVRTAKLACRSAPTSDNPHGVQTLLEIKAEGGFVIVHPSGGSVHETGRQYRRLAGGPKTVTTVTHDEYLHLLRIARMLDEMPPKAGGPPTSRTSWRSGDGLNDQADETWWRAHTEPFGWQWVYERGGEWFLRRPGKEHGHSATWNWDNRGRFRVFTSSTTAEPRMYDAFGWYAHSYHDDDLRAAGKALATSGYGPPTTFTAGTGSDNLDDDASEHTRLSRTLAVYGNRFYARSGSEWHPISNFIAWVDAYVIEDDGSGIEKTMLRICGTLDTGEVLPATIVPGDEFETMRWITARGGAAWRRAVVEAGPATRDRIRAAIQHLSKDRAAVERRFTHTGWRRVDGEMVFLNNAGAIGPGTIRTDINVHLDNGLERYAFETLPPRETLCEHGRRWMRILELAPDRIIAPAVATVPRAILGEMIPLDVAVFLYGRTGVFKSELAALLAAHFGRELDRLHLPINWESTANSIEAANYKLKDVVAPNDDFAPAGSSYQVATQHATLERMLRGIGNNSGRGRMNADGTLRQTFHPRGLPIITGEENPRGHSATARAQHIEIGVGDIDPAVLTDCQALAATGVFEELTAGFIAEIARDWDHARSQVRSLHASHLIEARSMTFGHARTGEAVAGQWTAVDIWFGYLAALGAISQAELRECRTSMRAGILAAGTSQAGAVANVDPVTLFLELARASIASEAAHLADRSTNGEPNYASRFGWRVEKIGTRDSVQPVGKPQGRRIGWVALETDSVYLNLPAAVAVVQDLGSKLGQPIPITPKTLAKRIADRGLIKSSEVGRTLQKVYVDGAQHRALHLALSEFLPADPESEANHTFPIVWEAAS